MSVVRPIRRQPVLLLAVALLALVGLAGAGCSGPSETSPGTIAATPSSSPPGWRAQARQLLTQYGLEPNGGMQLMRQGALRSGEMSFELCASARGPSASTLALMSARGRAGTLCR